MSPAEITSMIALLTGVLGVWLALRKQSAAGLDRITNRQADTESELILLQNKVVRLEQMLSEKEEMIRVITREVISIQLDLKDANTKLANIDDSHDDCKQELGVARHQIDALQITVEKMSKDLAAMDEIQQDADYHRQENAQLKRRIEDLIRNKS